MAQTSQPGTQKSIFQRKDLSRSHDILTCTINAPAFSYAHLELVSDGDLPVELDNLQAKSYCVVALRQFLGLTGMAVSLDVLKVEGSHCWLRVPRPDLGSFAAAITAWRGPGDGGVPCVLQIRQCSDWLGAMVGSDGQDELWNS